MGVDRRVPERGDVLTTVTGVRPDPVRTITEVCRTAGVDRGDGDKPAGRGTQLPSSCQVSRSQCCNAAGLTPDSQRAPLGGPEERRGEGGGGGSRCTSWSSGSGPGSGAGGGSCSFTPTLRAGP